MFTTIKDYAYCAVKIYNPPPPNMFKQGARPRWAGPGPRHCKDIVQGLNDVYWLKHETPKLLTNRR